MDIAVSIFAPLIGFLCGSIPTALLLGRTQGIDIRRHGSGNVGATNAFRVLGKKLGTLCLVIDALKGYLPVVLLTWLYLAAAVNWVGYDAWRWLIGIGAIAGHMFSPFLNFRGGKGVATSIGVMLAIAPFELLTCAIIAAFIIWFTGYVSLASVICAALLPMLILCYGLYRHFNSHTPIPWFSVVATTMLAVIIAWKHRANIQRLRAGTEPKIFDRLDAQMAGK